MTIKTKEKILVAIAYLALHNMKVNKQRVANYSGLSWVTVSRYFDDLPSLFMLDDIEKFKSNYKGVTHDN